jgi:hypothetical protein
MWSASRISACQLSAHAAAIRRHSSGVVNESYSPVTVRTGACGGRLVSRP